jgi:hypothetical protein
VAGDLKNRSAGAATAQRGRRIAPAPDSDREGTITADYPLMLLNGDKRQLYDKLIGCLRSPEMQSRLMQETQRRPVVPRVQPDARFSDHPLVELPFVRTTGEIDAVLTRLLHLEKADHAAYTIRETALTYLPETLENYLRLPKAYRRLHRLNDGQTSRALLLEQLELLAADGADSRRSAPG